MKFISVREGKSTLSETIVEAKSSEPSSRNTASQSACWSDARVTRSRMF